MNELTLRIEQVEAELSRLIGHDVELIGRPSLTGQTVFLVVPKDRSKLRSLFWREVQTSASMGIWLSPEAATVAFAAGHQAWLIKACRMGPRELASALAERLAKGPIAAANVLGEFAAKGVSVHRVGRIARRLGVIRRKSGMRGGWVWSQAEGRVQTSDVE